MWGVRCRGFESSVFLRASSRASPLPQGICDRHKTIVGASLLAMASVQAPQITEQTPAPW
ncbi:hypothetical protein DKY63_10745 [Pseudomonas putida]|uniref:Uncharacterized protein n=1 Tax=Pseudomonas putida TaxID=303 RepID=A0A2Z4RH60_PSEPU|nr:hypothetical protein DKY63_10745 [Pseudomonas putida]